jgi:Carboxypeptidase regulatory-like domain
LNLRTILVLSVACWVSISASCLMAAPNSGRISGIVLDPSGTGQMGATVLVTSEQLFNAFQFELLTNDRGRFSTSSIPAGAYSIKVTLVGFLPAMEQHIEVSDRRITLLEVMLGSVLSSFGKLRQQPDQKLSKDDWTWALRTSPATRSVLQFQDAQVVVVGQASTETVPAQTGRALVQLSSGGDHPGSVGDLADSPGTAFVYDVGLRNSAQLLMAGQFSSERGASAASFAGEWLPSGKPGV